MTKPAVHNAQSIRDFMAQIETLIKSHNVDGIAIALANTDGLTTHQYGLDTRDLVIIGKLFERFANTFEEAKQ